MILPGLTPVGWAHDRPFHALLLTVDLDGKDAVISGLQLHSLGSIPQCHESKPFSLLLHIMAQLEAAHYFSQFPALFEMSLSN